MILDPEFVHAAFALAWAIVVVLAIGLGIVGWACVRVASKADSEALRAIYARYLGDD